MHWLTGRIPHGMEGPGAALPLSSMLVSAWASSHILSSRSRKAGHGQPQINHLPPKKKKTCPFQGHYSVPWKDSIVPAWNQAIPVAKGLSFFSEREMGVGRIC